MGQFSMVLPRALSSPSTFALFALQAHGQCIVSIGA